MQEAFPGSLFLKIHGGAFQNIGIPDLLCCVQGRFIGLELKVKGNKATPAQQLMIERINEAMGRASVVYSVEEAVEFVSQSLKREKRR